MSKHPYYLLIFLSLCSCKPDQVSDWKKITSAEELWQTYPERLQTLFADLDLSQPGLAPVQNHLNAQDTVAAAEALLEYYRQTDRKWVVSALGDLPEADALHLANTLLADSVIIHEVADKVPLQADGGWQWDYTGPVQDDEFGYSLNGHSYLPALLRAWQKTGEEQYLQVMDRILKDWITHHSLPPAGDSIYVVLDTTQSIDWRDIGEVEWRTLETGNRLGATWPQLFYSLQQEETFSPAVRLLMLSSLAEQAAYLRQYHKRGHNWTTMEMNGLALTALAFPEFKDSEDWAAYALSTMSGEIKRQVYPDGVQTEISTKTQWVALRRFESVAEHFEHAGREVSEAYRRRLEEMYHYLAYSMRPDGHQPLNNDSDREDLRPRVLKAAEKFDRPDWQWIAANGRAGKKPEAGPSLTFPWAGIHVLRNGWGEPAHWAFFDTGPYGTGHQHRDKLHLSVSAFGKDLLVDGGRYTHQDYFSFDPAIWRGYFRSSFSHNLILVDGKGQKAGPVRGEAPLEETVDYQHTPQYDYAYGEFTDGYEEVEGIIKHQRSVLYVKDRFWLVLDQIETDRPRELQTLWHYAPDCEVALEAAQAVSTNAGEANLRIVPLGRVAWRTEIVAGQEEPFIQGWYSENYGTKMPNPTVIYSATIDQSSTFAWLLAPAQGVVPEINAEMDQENQMVTFRISEGNKNPVRVSLPLIKDPSKVRLDL